MEARQRLTRFLCQELLYEFVSGRLDPERQKAVDNYLADCRDSQREFESLKKGIAYAGQASRIRVSSELHQALLSFEPQWKKRLAAWTLWSSHRGWRVLPYIFVAIALILGVRVLKPFAGGHNQLTLLEQVKTEPDIVSKPADIKMESSALTPPPMAPEPAPTPLVEPQVQKPEQREEVAPTQGFLTRGDMEVSDFENAWPQIRDKIKALDGHPAGNVELGWLRRTGESYFHFSLPESNRAELELFLKTFGPVRFSTEKHPRVMPEGQIRIILTVKDGGARDGREETETP